MRKIVLSTLFVLLVSTARAEDSPPRDFGLDHRTPWMNSKLVGSPEPPLPYTVEKIFPKLDLPTPIYIAVEPGSNWLWVIVHAAGDKPSRIVRFENAPDISTFETIYEAPDRIIYSVGFDPDFAANRRVFVFTNGPTKEAERQDRVARYEFDAGPPARLLPESELAIIQWRSAGHDGGDLAFGNDGMLYLTTGDGTGDSDGWNSGQTVDDLLGSVLRIDVRDATLENPYRVPDDNPFVKLPGAKPEIWAYGLRNPWRMSYDSKSDQLWVGNNGQDLWETAHLVRPGENYGWSVYEGSHPFYLERQRGPTPIVPPTVEHSHAEFRSLTGGVVYHGDVLPDLDGAYVYGDYSSGRIWGMKHDGTKPLWHRELADTSLMLSGFVVDGHGQLLIADHGSGIYRLIPSPDSEPRAPFPTLLSETGLFADTAAHQVDPGLIPYSVNAPAWMDGATAERFMAVPGESKVSYSAGSSWTFPDGTALVQTLYMQVKPGESASPLRVETRVLLKQQNEWAGYSYRWNDSQTDAELVPRGGAETELNIATTDGHLEKQKWRFPSRTDCLACHSRAANFVLGISESQLNRRHGYASGTFPQLETLDHIGLFAAELPKTETERPRLADPYDSACDLEARARAYLHVNCAVCHIAAGGGNARMELGSGTPHEKLELIEARPQHDSFGLANAMLVAPGDSDRSVLVHRLATRGKGQMPPVWSNRVDKEAVALFRQWIAELKPSKPLVREWRLADLAPRLDALATDRSLAAGEKAFRETGCAQCHKVGDEGGTVGPNLSDIGKRIPPTELLESIVEPSAKIADVYATWLVQTADGQTHSGRIDREDQGVLVLRGGSALDALVEIPVADIEARRKSEVSNMPAGAVNVLHEHEVLDLLAYLLSLQGK
jgi:uncharacterized repeat protein (TIGR03806 family)